MDEDFNELADALMGENRFEEARALLESGVQRMPRGWKPVQEDPLFVRIAFWDEEEFFAYVQDQGAAPTKPVLWAGASYSRGWYALGALASNQERLEHALFCMDCGIELEPDHPELWSEKGFILARLGRHEAALDCYTRAATIRSWAPQTQIARALRGKGVQLVDLNRIEEAEAALRQSLEMEPDSDIAHKELEYIEQLRSQDAKAKEKIPWFMHSFANPPADPLTVQLIALVEDLPPIAGPRTVGTENYSKILRAFMDRGWAGFEEEFGHIVPRDRPDYEQVKRDLLCEPVFKMKAHRNLARAFMAESGASEETLEDVIKDIFRDPGNQTRNRSRWKSAPQRGLGLLAAIAVLGRAAQQRN